MRYGRFDRPRRPREPFVYIQRRPDDAHSLIPSSPEDRPVPYKVKLAKMFLILVLSSFVVLTVLSIPSLYITKYFIKEEEASLADVWHFHQAKFFAVILLTKIKICPMKKNYLFF
jgi:cbb3-type cytochrome oxidase subunit 3